MFFSNLIGLLYLCIYVYVCFLSCVLGGNGNATSTTAPKCRKDKWGPDCSSPCSYRCFDYVCESVKGLCTKGCLGYGNPPMCDEECSNNTFGKNCNELCPDLCNTFINVNSNYVCHHVTGKCLSSFLHAYMGIDTDVSYSSVVVSICTISVFAILVACTVNYLQNWSVSKRKASISSNTSSFIECGKTSSDVPPCEQNESKMNFFSGSSTSFVVNFTPIIEVKETEV